MELDEAIGGRRSVRDYTEVGLGKDAIARLIDAAIYAPSAVNEQPWVFTVIRDRGLLDRISRDAKAHMLATLPGDSRSAHFRTMLTDPAFHIFYHAPVLIVISARADGPWIVEDCALAAQNLMLSAYGAGLGSCWIGFAQSFLNTSDGKALLGLAPGCVPVAPIVVGHASAPVRRVARTAPEVHWIG